MVDLASLPTETLVDILSWLGYRDILQCEAACRRLRDITRSSLLVRYLIELDVAGMIEGPTLRNLSIADRLNHVLNWQSSWRHPQPRIIRTIPLSWTSYSIFHCCGDLFVRAYMDIGGPPEHVLRTSIFNRLDVIHLPTCEEATPTWTLQFDKDFSSFVLDPAQDLLVLWESSPIVRGVGIQLYVLSLRHGTPVWAHPLLIPLESDIRDSKFISTHKVLIAGEFLVMCTIGRNNLLLEMNVVRWSTGAVQARFSRKLDRGTFYQGFCMLSTNYFAIGIFSHPSSASAKIEVYSFDDTINPDVQAHPKPIAHVATYHLPQMHPNAYVLRFALETSPAPGLYTPEAHHSPFLFSPSSALLAITLFCMQGEVRTANDTIRCLIATRVSALLAMIVGYSHDTLGPAIFPWDSWGPASTRWFRLGPDIYKSRPLHGSRILVGNDLVDFSSLDIARDLCLRGMDGSRRAVDDSREIAIGHTGSENGEASNHRGTPSSIISMIVTEPTIIAGGNIFLKDVASKLIFRSAPCEVPRKCHHIFGGESWVGVETSPNDKVEALHILAV